MVRRRPPGPAVNWDRGPENFGPGKNKYRKYSICKVLYYLVRLGGIAETRAGKTARQVGAIGVSIVPAKYYDTQSANAAGTKSGPKSRRGVGQIT